MQAKSPASAGLFNSPPQPGGCNLLFLVCNLGGAGSNRLVLFLVTISDPILGLGQQISVCLGGIGRFFLGLLSFDGIDRWRCRQFCRSQTHHATHHHRGNQLPYFRRVHCFHPSFMADAAAGLVAPPPLFCWAISSRYQYS